MSSAARAGAASTSTRRIAAATAPVQPCAWKGRRLISERGAEPHEDLDGPRMFDELVPEVDSNGAEPDSPADASQPLVGQRHRRTRGRRLSQIEKRDQPRA